MNGAFRSVLGHRSQSDFATAERSNWISEAAPHTPLAPPPKGGDDGLFGAGRVQNKTGMKTQSVEPQVFETRLGAGWDPELFGLFVLSEPS